MIKIATEILKGSQHSLLTQQQGEDMYRNLIYDSAVVTQSFNPYLRIDFNYPQPSLKVRYAQDIINAGIISELNKIIYETCDPMPTRERVAYKLMKIDRAIKPLLATLQSVIDENQYDLSLLSRPDTRFTDRLYYSNIYICHYLQVAIIYFVMEFQAQFADYIPENKYISISKIYNEYLLMQVPQDTHLKEIKKIEIKQAQIEATPVETLPTNAQIFLTEVQKYSFTELPKLQELTPRQVQILITKMVEKQAPYAVAMLSFLEYDKMLKNRYNVNKENIYKHISIALNNVGPRQIKGNFLVLNERSKEDPTRYTSHQFKDIVIEDYKNIKLTY